MKKLFMYFFIFILIPSSVYSWCSAPSPPYYKPSKPSVPWCVNEWNNTHTCDEWEISSYNNSIRNYNYEVERYIMDLQNYVDSARNYANCEINSLN
ncbi:MAG: hypothetical protein CFH22_01448 [Alphaproteobacteria bacterium MarineAlpha5_Bin12]|nr:MAG: hypothetical protein CFH22_01448 [Alphaproteobacteria bacterium MarineAlpha5_Bin12]